MTATDTSEPPEDDHVSDTGEDDGLPVAVKVMMLLIALALLGVVVLDVLHFVGAF